ncbi:hypothetical protein TWF718_002906 [Orbilia javanica]|uniref:F-box domain-containing protein n=1 Tax=Orbilia javanica TaxID=47235 RepID=A0AAN8MPL4_9PEZI
MATVSTIFPLPSELSFEILSFLPLQDLKNLSTCSKAARRFTSSVLFRGVKLCPGGSVEAFGDGGGLEGVIGGVRSVHISYPKQMGVREYVSFFRAVTPLLSKFVGVKTLKIGLVSSFEQNTRILGAVFKQLSAYSWYDGLKRLDILWVDFVFFQDRHLKFRGDDLEFLESGSGYTEKKWPKGIEEVRVANQVMEGWRFRKDEKSVNGSFGENLVAGLGGYGGGEEAGRLKVVEISATGIVTNKNWRELGKKYLETDGDDSAGGVEERGWFKKQMLKVNRNFTIGKGTKGGDRMVRFPTVRKVMVDVMRFKKRNLAEMVMRFSMVEELEVWVWLVHFGESHEEMVPRYKRGQVVWKDIVGLRKVRKVVLPWPLVDGEGVRHQHVEKEQLKESVAWWIKQWESNTDRGEEGVTIENVRFVMWRFGIGEEFLDFKIVRETSYNTYYWRVEHGKRKYTGGMEGIGSMWSMKGDVEKATVDVDVEGWVVEEEGVEGYMKNLEENRKEEAEEGGYEGEGGGMEFEDWEE